MVGTQAGALDGLGLLHLDDQLAGVEDLVGGTGDDRTGLLVLTVREARPFSGAGLDDHLVAAGGQLTGSCRGQADPSFGCLDLCGNSDVHPAGPLVGGGVVGDAPGWDKQ